MNDNDIDEKVLSFKEAQEVPMMEAEETTTTTADTNPSDITILILNNVCRLHQQ